MGKRFHVLVAGGGFAGIALTTNLVRDARQRLQITLLEAGGTLGRGPEGRREESPVPLPFTAGVAGLFPDDPGHFLRWANATPGPVEAADPVDARAFGDYLEDTFIATVGSTARNDLHLSASTGVQILDITAQDGLLAAALDDGRILSCDAVVLTADPPVMAAGTGWGRAPAGDDRLEQRLVARGILPGHPRRRGGRLTRTGESIGFDGGATGLFVLETARRGPAALAALRYQAEVAARELLRRSIPATATVLRLIRQPLQFAASP